MKLSELVLDGTEGFALTLFSVKCAGLKDVLGKCSEILLRKEATAALRSDSDGPRGAFQRSAHKVP